MDLSQSVNKIIKTTQPHFVLPVRQYGSVATPSVPIPNMALTEAVKKKMEAKIWVDKVGGSVVMVVEIPTGQEVKEE
jgi:hypothetical protein